MFDPRTEPLDSRLALRVYAALVGTSGFLVAAWGQAWLGSHLAELPWGGAALVRIGGAVMVAAAMIAWGLSTADVRARKRLLSWFIGAHVVVWLMLAVQSTATLEQVPLARQGAWGLLMVITGLFYVRASADAWVRRSSLTFIRAAYDASAAPETQDAAGRRIRAVPLTGDGSARRRVGREAVHTSYRPTVSGPDHSSRPQSRFRLPLPQHQWRNPENHAPTRVDAA